MGKARQQRLWWSWMSARTRALRMRERWLHELARGAALSTGEQVSQLLLLEVRADRDRAEDTLDRVSELLGRWGEGGPMTPEQARNELIEALNRRDGRDVRVARLRTKVRELRAGLAEAGRGREVAEGVRTEAEAQRDRALALLDNVLQAPLVRFEENGPTYMEGSVLRQALNLADPKPALPVRPRTKGVARGQEQ